ncbi:hypothetical protein F3Y22_tig00111693pilonHSYRG00046 [Hibiscus syriacus]|uniref:Reverse transcriptase zinc-binding domain-containing protein n=1 Tax=Hibiscus syriacus TaxID=106335 RepID=A0A6A2XXY2_HIBSY|nr:hypothetical protein F3Y22_tig00111693pilonHSYRG00046 [Hibiscus syriacus]
MAFHEVPANVHLPNLKTLHFAYSEFIDGGSVLRGFNVIEINAPNLVYFKYVDGMAEGYTLSEMKSLERTHIEITLTDSEDLERAANLLQGVCNVQSLYLAIEDDSKMLFLAPLDPMLAFNNLVELEFRNYLNDDWQGTWILEFLHCMPNLKTLVLDLLNLSVDLPTGSRFEQLLVFDLQVHRKASGHGVQRCLRVCYLTSRRLKSNDLRTRSISNGERLRTFARKDQTTVAALVWQLILLASILKTVDQFCSRFSGNELINQQPVPEACIISLIRKVLAGSNVSWSFHRILKLRPIAYPIVTFAPQPIREVWDMIRTQGIKVHWHRLIWYPLHIPKHSLISWMALLDRLPTRDRLRRMGLCSDSICVSCCQFQESRDHLFSQCSFAVGLWKAILKLNGMSYSPLTWETMVSWASTSWKGKSLITTLLNISWNAFIYSIWKERNQHIFQGRFRSIDSLLKDIVEAVSIRLRGKAIDRLDSTNFYLCNAWGIV